MPPTIIFIHIPRTAGTSTRTALDSVLAEDERIYTYAQRSWAVRPDQLSEVDEETRRRAKLVFGHAPFGLHRQMPQRCLYATLVRDPVERVISNFFFYANTLAKRTARGLPPGTRMERAVAAGEIDLAGYLRSEGPAPPPNLMTRWIAGRGKAGGSDDPQLLEQARQRIERRFVGIGTTRNSQGFIDLLAQHMGWGKVEVGRVNPNPRRTASEDLDPGLLDLARERNALDVALYEWVEEATERGRLLHPGRAGT